MTDHTAIIERMARALEDAGLHPIDAQEAAERALSASGLLEVLEKAEPFEKFGDVLLEKFPKHGGLLLNGGTPDAAELTPADFAALRNAIKGVRDGK